MLAADEPAGGWSSASPRAAGSMSRRKQARPQHLREEQEEQEEQEEDGPARTRASQNGMLQKRVRIHLDFFINIIICLWDNESGWFVWLNVRRG